MKLGKNYSHCADVGVFPGPPTLPLPKLVDLFSDFFLVPPPLHIGSLTDTGHVKILLAVGRG